MTGHWKRWLSKAGMCVIWASVLSFVAWSIGAIAELTWLPRFVRVPLALVYLGGMVALFRRAPNRIRWLSWAAASIIAVYGLTLFQQPSHDRVWVAEQSRMPEITVTDGQVQIRNLRHSVYRTETDFDVHYRDEQFPLEQLTGVWFLMQRFTPLNGLAHTFISFERQTENGPEFFGVSVEVRRELDEDYSPIRGLYRRFELIYIVGDERDVIGMRTNMRDDRVFLYRVNATPEQVQQLFLDIAARTERLRVQPEFYHTLLNNCTNNIVGHTYELTPEPINALDPRIVLPGYSPRFAWHVGLIGNRDEPLAELQARSRIDRVAKQVGVTDRFSLDIRGQ